MNTEDISLKENKPLPIGVCVTGNFYTTRMPLEYLILLLNSKQSLFEYQLIKIETFRNDIINVVGKGSKEELLLSQMIKGDTITEGKLHLKHVIHDIATILGTEINKRTAIWDQAQNPSFFIFVTTSKHKDSSFFQEDGSNGFSKGNPCRGACILTGHHERRLAPPTCIEFIFKFIFRISCKVKYSDFSRSVRHWGCKSCLFDFSSDPSFLRYLVLHNYICHSCSSILGAEATAEIKSALCTDNLYGKTIERHPAKISSELGFNLSLVKGLYKTKYDEVLQSISSSFFSRLGSLMAFGILLTAIHSTQTDTYYLGYLF